MKRHGFIIAIYFLSSLSVFGQKLDWIETRETDDQVAKFIGEIDGYVYTLTHLPSPQKNQPKIDKNSIASTFTLDKFSKDDLKLVFSKRIVLPRINKREVSFSNIYMTGDRFTVFFQQYDPRDNNLRLFSTTVNTEGELADDYTEVFDLDVEAKGRKGGFQIRLSPDKSKMLVLHAANYKLEPDKQKYNPEYKVKFSIKIYAAANGLVELQYIEEEIKFKQGEYGFFPDNSTISNEGCAYVMVKKRRTDKRPSYVTKAFIIYTYDPANGFSSNQIPVEINESPVGSVLLDTDDAGNLVGVGLYGVPEKPNGFGADCLKGTFLFKINRANAQLESYGTQDLPIKFHKEILGESNVTRKKERLLHFFVPRNMYLLDDHVILVSEYATSRRSMSSDANGKKVTDGFFFNSNTILVFNIDFKGKHNWVKASHKKQKIKTRKFPAGDPISNSASFKRLTRSISGSTHKMKRPGLPYTSTWSNTRVYGYYDIRHHSFLSVYNDGILSLLFYQALENIEVPLFADMKKDAGLKNLGLVCVQISSDGTLNKKVINKPVKRETLMHMNMAYPKSENEIIVVGSGNKDKSFGVITF